MKALTIAVQTKGHGAYARQRRAADALINAGHEVLWLAPGMEWRGKEKLLTLDEDKPAVSLGPLTWIRRLERAFERYREEIEDVDVVFTVREYDALACKLSRLLRDKPHVFFQRGDTIECERFNFRHPVFFRDRITRPVTLAVYPRLQRYLFPKLDRIVVQAEFLKKLIEKRYPGLALDIDVLPNDCDIRWVHEDEENDGYERINEHKRRGVPLIGMVAPVYWHGKGFGVFLEALKIMHRKKIPFTALVIGYGPEEGRVLDFIKSENIGDSVKFIGRVQGAYRYMGLFDVMVMPTKMVDACPNVVLEALSKETAIMASGIDAHVALLDHSRLLFESENPSDLAMKLEKLLGDEREMEANRSLVKERKKVFTFDWDARVVSIITGAARLRMAER